MSPARPLLSLALLIVLLAVPGPAALAGPESDALARCLIAETSVRDRTRLVRWLFAALAVHPAVRDLANVTPAQIEAANRDAAALVQTLLVDSCREPAARAMQREGVDTLRSSFEVLGGVAGQQIFANRDVAAAMTGLGRHIDGAALERALAPQD